MVVEIRESFRQALLARVDKLGWFERMDYDAQMAFKADEEVVELKMIYRHQPAYRMEARIPLKKTAPSHAYRLAEGDIPLLVSPGEILSTEEEVAPNYQNVVIGIDRWLVRVRDEVRASPQSREVAEEAQELQTVVKRLEQRGDDLDRYMSRDEVGEVLERLKDLEADLKLEAENAAQGRADLDARLAALTRDFQALREQAPALRRRGWVQSFGAKRARWMRDRHYRQVAGLQNDESGPLLLTAS